MTSGSAVDRTLRKQRNKEYPIQLWYFLACFIFLVGAKQGTLDSESHIIPSSSSVNLRRLPSAILNTYRIVALRWTIRINLGTVYTLNVAEIAITCAYIIAIFTWSFINTTALTGQKFNLQYWNNRAGTIAASQLPLVTALSSKNNVITFITGIGYDKLNYAHRMTSRVLFVLIWAHVGGELVRTIDAEDLASVWLRCGLMGAIALTALVLVSLRPVRAKAYELFFWVHFVTVLLFLVGAYFHAREFDFQSYVWPCFVIWGFDRLVRGLRVLLFTITSPSTSIQGADVEKHHIPSMAASVKLEMITSTIVRLTVPRPRLFHWSAGQSVFLTVPGVSKFTHEAHPFTIASIEDHDNMAPVKQTNELVFFINVQSGFTQRLAAHASRTTTNGNSSLTSKVYVDGPYGSAPDLRGFDTCVLVAGGSGVSFTLALLLDVIRNAAKNASAVQRVVFVWAVRDIRNVALIKPALIKALESQTQPQALKIDIRIHLTGSNGPSEESIEKSASSSSTSVEKPTPQGQLDLEALTGFAEVSLYDGRPDIAAIMTEEVQVTRNGRMGVAVCGSDSMVQSSRSALGLGTAGMKAVLKGGASVSLFIEGFAYA
ncbi:hypothetical protein FIBSPDRAFT_810265 [Athelia psychrophila]|uniref:ferric-chelate reductase (NADPH) n=1 Tax=Athelia psychrophila TaxID=1759441 RepID=A0A166WHB8_9AGAM|nr:hypothetical protein FIBSPDRAFT_810265 [Fibularhizoctonia sp. CBS 109695]